MILSSGAKCDVCGDYILPLDPDELVNEFGVKGIERTLHCHNRCKAAVLACGHDWTALPAGPLRTGFEIAANREEGRDE